MSERAARGDGAHRCGDGGLCRRREKRGRCRCRSDPKQNGTLAAEVWDRKKQFNLKAAPDFPLGQFWDGVNGIPSQASNPDGADHNGSHCIKPRHRTPSRAHGQRRRPLARAARIGATTMAISGLIGRICHMILIHQALHTVAAIYEVVMKPQPEHDANMHASVFV